MRRTLTRWLCLGSALVTFSNALAGTPPVAPVPTDAHPLRFVPNQRQWQSPILFAADIPAGRLFLERDRLLVARYDAPAIDRRHHAAPSAAPQRIANHAYAVRFVDANAQAEVRGEQPTGEHLNYFLGNDEARWATNVPAFTDVRYQQLYPGTDLRFYSRGAVMEYDFELAAGADAGRIKLRYEGQESLSVVEGALHIGTSVGRVTEQQPYAYQVVEGRRVAVACRYVLGPQHTVSFGLPKGYDHSRPLVIDPVLVYSTYSGATAALNWGYTACPDSLGNLYAASINFTAGYPTTLGAYDTNFNNGNTDIVISKYNPSATTGASSLVYATYLGGNQEDYPHSLVVNRANELVLLGSTNSTNFPTPGGYRTSLAGGTDLVLAKLSANGSSLLGATYVGGSANDGRMLTTSNLYANFGDDFRGDVITDRQNNVYFTSVTRSTNFPTSGGRTYQGGHDAVVMKLSPGLSTMLWSTYLGGTGDDAGYSIQLDSVNNVFVAGGTTSTNFPSAAGGLNASYRGGPADGFVSRLQQNLTSAGVAIQQTTYLGTSSYDQAFFVQLDRKSAVYVLGQTNGAYPVTTGTYRNAGSRQFIHKLGADLRTTGYSTVVGNGAGTATTANPYPTNLAPTAFLVDNCGQLLLSGYGASSIAGMPTTPDALQPTASNSTSGAAADANLNTYGYLYVMQLSANARRLVYGTYFGTGTTHVDGGTSRFDKKGIIYQAMCVRFQQTGSNIAPAIITTPNAYARTQTRTSAQTTSAAFKMDIARLDASFVPAANGVANTRVGCAPLTVLFTRATPSNNGTTWSFGNGQTSTQPNNVRVTYTAPGRYPITLTAYDSTSCQAAVVGRDTVTVLGPLPAALGPDQTICPGSSATLTVAGGSASQAYYLWRPATGLNTTNGTQVIASPAVTTQYIVTVVPFGGICESRDTIVVNVRSALTVAIPPVAALCPGTTGTLTTADAGAGATYVWSPATGLSTTTGRTVTATPTATTTYTVRVTNATGCTGTATVTVTVLDRLTVSLGPDVSFCGATGVAQLRVSAPDAATTYTWTPATGLNTTTGPAVTARPTATTQYIVTATRPGGCPARDTIVVNVESTLQLPIHFAPALPKAGELITFSDTLAGVRPDLVRRWEFGDGTIVTGRNPTHTYAAPGTYTVLLSAASAGGSCALITRSTIVVIPARDFAFPNVITPNGDNQNDDFRPYVSAEPVTLQIFTRWGRKVFEQANYTQGWGSAPDVAAGIYYYQLRTAAGQTWKGWLEVVK
ncbi:PKD domain-containing protein [Hymenobacter artigasi]|uniref:Gliding motility-associated-like protein n=1 Tax=Hymenobacter artigasi TaxID=2719616 RepID=A0ABX1HJU8_9BACT|nr:PKD domain-containing protein [Hymenobacter artigasi]NKI90390.1 gliding motility-associated-like protein [Hymenobacter artigasi]